MPIFTFDVRRQHAQQSGRKNNQKSNDAAQRRRCTNNINVRSWWILPDTLLSYRQTWYWYAPCHIDLFMCIQYRLIGLTRVCPTTFGREWCFHLGKSERCSKWLHPIAPVNVNILNVDIAMQHELIRDQLVASWINWSVVILYVHNFQYSKW